MREAGIDIKKMVEGYLKSLKSEESEDVKSPSWEMNNCEVTTADEGFTFGRIYEETHDIVMMMNILLPGSSVVYYGDEIGMTGFLDDLTNDTTRDPYVDINCAGNDDDNCYLLKSRDPMRTPMQWTDTVEDNSWLPFLKSSSEFNVKAEEEMSEEDKMIN